MSATRPRAGDMSLSELVTLQDALRRALQNSLTSGPDESDKHHAHDRYLNARHAYETALFAYMEQTGRGKRVYDDIEAARAAQQGA